eukprot:gene8326-10226_t
MLFKSLTSISGVNTVNKFNGSVSGSQFTNTQSGNQNTLLAVDAYVDAHVNILDGIKFSPSKPIDSYEEFNKLSKDLNIVKLSLNMSILNIRTKEEIKEFYLKFKVPNTVKSLEMFWMREVAPIPAGFIPNSVTSLYILLQNAISTKSSKPVSSDVFGVGSLPESINKLKIHHNMMGSVMDKPNEVFPSSITNLTIYEFDCTRHYKDNSGLNSLYIPISVKKLNIMSQKTEMEDEENEEGERNSREPKDKVFSIVYGDLISEFSYEGDKDAILKGLIPKNVKKLSILNVNQMEKGSIPMGVEEIEFSLNFPLDPREIPSSVRHLAFEPNDEDFGKEDHSTPILIPGHNIPSTVTSVFVNGIENWKYNNQLPAELLKFKCIYSPHYNQVKIPDTVEFLDLTFRPELNPKSIVIPNYLPKSLKELNMEGLGLEKGFQHFNKCQQLKSMKFSAFSKPISLKKGSLSPSLKHLDLGIYFTSPLEKGALPQGLESISGVFYSVPVDQVHFPPSIKEIDFQLGCILELSDNIPDTTFEYLAHALQTIPGVRCKFFDIFTFQTTLGFNDQYIYYSNGLGFDEGFISKNSSSQQLVSTLKSIIIPYYHYMNIRFDEEGEEGEEG